MYVKIFSHIYWGKNVDIFSVFLMYMKNHSNFSSLNTFKVCYGKSFLTCLTGFSLLGTNSSFYFLLCISDFKIIKWGI